MPFSGTLGEGRRRILNSSDVASLAWLGWLKITKDIRSCCCRCFGLFVFVRGGAWAFKNKLYFAGNNVAICITVCNRKPCLCHALHTQFLFPSLHFPFLSFSFQEKKEERMKIERFLFYSFVLASPSLISGFSSLLLAHHFPSLCICYNFANFFQSKVTHWQPQDLSCFT